MFWDMIMKYETLILVFVRAHRDKDFALYFAVLEELAVLFFALDHVNYSRWVPIHLRDMKSLPPEINAEFNERSHWVLSKTSRKSSAIPFDQSHEQENKIVKDTGGAVGLTENPSAFRRWMLSGPELGRLVTEFEEEYLNTEELDSDACFQHHEHGLSSQKLFHIQVSSLTKIMKQMGNPFLDEFPELVTLDNRNCTPESVITTMRTLESIGKEQYNEYVQFVLIKGTRSIHDPIHKNALPLFIKNQRTEISKQGKKIKVLQNNVALFGQLYISMQSRDGDLDEFFTHEIQSFPPSFVGPWET